MACTFQVTTGGKFAPHIGLRDEDMDFNTWIITYSAAVTDAPVRYLRRNNAGKKPWVTRDTLDLCDGRRNLKKKRYEAEGEKNTEKETRGLRRK